MMIPYSKDPVQLLSTKHGSLASFIDRTDKNIDWITVQSFGEEWGKFDNTSPEDIEKIGRDYFDLADPSMLHRGAEVLDVGCGNGRWAQFISSRVGFVEAIDPSHAAVIASRRLVSLPNVRVTQASVDEMPFPNGSFDFVYSLGVLHHVPQPRQGILRCYEKLKPGGWFLIYLYYNFEQRSLVYRLAWLASDLVRRIVCRLPGKAKRVACDILAVLIYWPLITFSRFISLFSSGLAESIPLSYYRKTSFQTIRNDSLDRFGTPLEQRFSKDQIKEMLTSAGFVSIQFSTKAPYWHAIAQKP